MTGALYRNGWPLVYSAWERWLNLASKPVTGGMSYKAMCLQASVAKGFTGYPGWLAPSEGRMNLKVIHGSPLCYGTVSSSCCFSGHTIRSTALRETLGPTLYFDLGNLIVSSPKINRKLPWIIGCEQVQNTEAIMRGKFCTLSPCFYFLVPIVFDLCNKSNGMWSSLGILSICTYIHTYIHIYIEELQKSDFVQIHLPVHYSWCKMNFKMHHGFFH